MADFTAFRSTGKTGFTNAEQREVVVQHKRIFVFAVNRINHLRVTGSAERSGYDGLCFTQRCSIFTEC
jgi:hypothetical protein